MSTNKSRATKLETVSIYEALKTCCTRTEDGCVVYHEGWSDARISRELGFKVGMIARTRRDIFGRFPKTRREAATPSREKLAAIEMKFTEIEVKFEDIADHLQHLDTRLNAHWEKITRLEGKFQLAFPEYDPKNSTSPLGLKKHS
jgi:hypothetical protein